MPNVGHSKYVSCQVCKLPPAWLRLSYPAINCGCFVTSSVRSSFANDPALIVALCDLPLVVLLTQDRAYQSNYRRLVREDSHHIGPPLDLLV